MESEEQVIGVVDTITEEFIHNEQRRVFKTQGDATINGLNFASDLFITEGIGYDFYGFFPGTDDSLTDICFGSLEECNILSSTENHVEIPEIKISPNPVHDHLNIESNLSISKITIHNELGQLMYKGVESKVELGFLNPGFYFVVVLLENKQTAKSKFIKVN